jgi:hypothetical protein
VLQGDDPLGVAHGAQAMPDDKDRAAAADAAQILLHDPHALAIKVAAERRLCSPNPAQPKCRGSVILAARSGAYDGQDRHRR